MSVVETDDLVEDFWQRVPARVAEMTDLWLAAEDGAREKLPVLRRALHTAKGEAQMLGLAECGRLLELTEKLVDSLVKLPELPSDMGDILLGAFEGLGMFASNHGVDEDLDLTSVVQQLEAAHEAIGAQVEEAASSGAATRPTGSVEPATSSEAGSSAGADASRDVSALEVVKEVQPFLLELRRLHAERGLLQPQLREAHRMLRALLAEMDLTLPPDLLKERLVKTLGYGTELERRLARARAAWSANEFATSLSLDQLDNAAQKVAFVSLDDLKQLANRVGRSTATTLGKEVVVEVSGTAFVDSNIEQRLRPCLVHLIRNAVDHGIEEPETRRARGKPEVGTLRLTVTQQESSVQIDVADDGDGIDFDAVRAAVAEWNPESATMSEKELIKLLLVHGVTTRSTVTEISGRGVGLDVVARELRALGGDIRVDSERGKGTRFVLVVPVTLRADLVVPVSAQGLRYAFPSRAVKQILRAERLEQTTTGTRLVLQHQGQTELIPAYALSALLFGQGETDKRHAAVILQHRSGSFAIMVESYENPRPATFQRIEDLPFNSEIIRGVTPAPDGGVLLLLDVEALGQRAGEGAAVSTHSTDVDRSAHVLVVEDAPVARELLAGVLRSFGLQVSEAIDGREGLAHARSETPDLILTDVEMPYLDGLDMIAALRDEPQTAAVPVIVLTTRVDDETRSRARALDVRGFLSKQKFVEDELREMIWDALGRK